MPGHIHKGGSVGVVSRSGTLTYEAVGQLTALGIGQSTCIGIGGDPIIGTNHTDALELFNEDRGTEAIVMIGEIGGNAEEEAAAYVKKHVKKPVVGFIAGPDGAARAAAWATRARSSPAARARPTEKMKAMAAAGIHVVKSPADIGAAVAKLLQEVAQNRRANVSETNVLDHQAGRGEGGQGRGRSWPASRRPGSVVALRLRHLTAREAEGFYHVHQRAALLRQPGRVHVLGALHHDGAGARGRDRAPARAHGRDRSGQGRRRAPSARTSRRRSRPTPSTARTPRRRRAFEIGYFFPGIELPRSGA